ncbi:TorF family putative porin [Phenylobacterium montanum]|uniref:TorF family putative porin n=1 Tax=Phenylobacterium montanum TaxID=2823693 RepID=A0A975IX18_9CAUL|nr:TorF family putative porin [Caulobacter sp. S6]QUD90483.1 TorF family putative porin [Caulobacter sp. S6]
MLALAPAGHAAAQAAFSATLQSDYQYRGISLSEGRPTLSLNLAYDHSSGAYAGASAIAVDAAHDGVEMLGFTAYAGYSHRLAQGLSWEVGASNTNATDYDAVKYTVNYTELYAGLSSERVSARIYYSPDYLGESRSSLYLDLNGSVSPAPHWRVFGHAGVLTPLSGSPWGGGRRELYDLRAGVAAQVKSCEFSLAYTAASPHIYAEPFRRERSALVASASYFF